MKGVFLLLSTEKATDSEKKKKKEKEEVFGENKKSRKWRMSRFRVLGVFTFSFFKPEKNLNKSLWRIFFLGKLAACEQRKNNRKDSKGIERFRF